MANKPASFSIDTVRFDRGVADFLRGMPELRDKVVKKLVFDIVANTMIGITEGTDGNPIRVDTGRYRGGWRAALRKGQPNDVGALPGGDSDAKARDGSYKVKSNKTTHEAAVSNNVEYGSFVEFGTSRMDPGNHLTTAIAKANKDRKVLEEVLTKEMADKWGE